MRFLTLPISALPFEPQLHARRGVPPATIMRKWSLPIRRRLRLSTFRKAPETRPLNALEAAGEANGNPVSGRNLCRYVPDSWPEFRVSTATRPETNSPWLCGDRNVLAALPYSLVAGNFPDFLAVLVGPVGRKRRRLREFLPFRRHLPPNEAGNFRSRRRELGIALQGICAGAARGTRAKDSGMKN